MNLCGETLKQLCPLVDIITAMKGKSVVSHNKNSMSENY